MSEEEKKAIETFIKKCERYDGSVEIKGISVGEETRILNTIVKFLKELNNLKEIEKSHKEENGKLRVELEQEKEKNNNLIKQLQEQNTEIQDISRQLRQEKEKNKELEEKLKIAKQLYNDACVCIATECVEKDKIKDKIEETNNEIIDISGFRCIAVEDIENLLEEK